MTGAPQPWNGASATFAQYWLGAGVFFPQRSHLSSLCHIFRELYWIVTLRQFFELWILERSGPSGGVCQKLRLLRRHQTNWLGFYSIWHVHLYRGAYKLCSCRIIIICSLKFRRGYRDLTLLRIPVLLLNRAPWNQRNIRIFQFDDSPSCIHCSNKGFQYKLHCQPTDCCSQGQLSERRSNKLRCVLLGKRCF